MKRLCVTDDHMNRGGWVDLEESVGIRAHLFFLSERGGNATTKDLNMDHTFNLTSDHRCPPVYLEENHMHSSNKANGSKKLSRSTLWEDLKSE